MAKAKKLPSGSWRVQVYTGKSADGKRIYKSFTADTKKEAEYAASEYVYNRKAENKSENLTFQQASDQYIAAKSNILSPSTIRGYRIIQRNSVPDILLVPLRKLADGALIQRQINANAAKYAAKSVRNQLGFITAVMAYHKYRVEGITTKPKENTGIAVPTQEDARKIMQLLDGDEIECQVLLALTCSLRQSEIAAITASDVNGSRIYIHGARVPDENNKLVYKCTAKTAAGTRTIKMHDDLARKVANLCAQRPDGWLFPTTPSGVLKRFKRILRKNGIPEYTMHSLRHCFAALLHAQNVPDQYVMEMGGWSSDHVLKKIYQYTFEAEAEKAKEKANALFDEMQHEMQHES